MFKRLRENVKQAQWCKGLSIVEYPILPLYVLGKKDLTSPEKSTRNLSFLHVRNWLVCRDTDLLDSLSIIYTNHYYPQQPVCLSVRKC